MTRHALRNGRAIRLLAALAALVAAGSAAASTTVDRYTVVKGGGSGVLTDPDGNTFPLNSFAVRARIGEGGAAKGSIHFRWRGSFAKAWGDPVCEGTCDTVVLRGDVESGSVASDGTIVLAGTAREIDKRRGKVIFDSGFDEPFEIIVTPGRDRFSLRWCLLPAFEIDGRIQARQRVGGGGGQPTTASLQGATACHRS